MQADVKARKPTRADYDAAFERERAVQYPAVDDFERRARWKADQAQLETAARVLACPIKKNSPNWQHGRVIFSAACRYLDAARDPALLLDIGTAKGFSAAVMCWAISKSRHHAAEVHSVDVVDPEAKVFRNSVKDIEGPTTVDELVTPYIPRDARVRFHGGGSAVFIAGLRDRRINFAFVDGKHSYIAVKADAAGIAARQQSGDVIIFDDMQIPGVADAVSELFGYHVEHLAAKPDRRYAIATRA